MRLAGKSAHRTHIWVWRSAPGRPAVSGIRFWGFYYAMPAGGG